MLVETFIIGFESHRHSVAQDYVQRSGFVSARIPSDQWIIEARAAESLVWASMQVMIADYAIGPGVRHPALVNATQTPETTGDKALCNSIKVRKAGGFV